MGVGDTIQCLNYRTLDLKELTHPLCSLGERLELVEALWGRGNLRESSQNFSDGCGIMRAYLMTGSVPT